MQPFLVLFVMLLGAPGRTKRAPIPALAPERLPLRVMTYNVNYANPDPSASIDAIATADADLVMLQEVTAAWREALVTRLAVQYPYRAVRVVRASGGLAVLSKFPIEREELVAHARMRPAQRAVVATPLGAVQLLNVHLRPAIDRGSWVRGYFTTPPVRRREIEAHWRRMVDHLPTLAAGDFNEAPSGSAVGFVEKRGLVRVRPRGPTSWRHETTVGGRKIEVLRLDIDHVLVGGLAIGDAEVLDVGTSDHRPVVVTVGKPS
jgi:endonuclease/exonuclease/phosphatase (EEP) superfamily protein YafD